MYEIIVMENGVELFRYDSSVIPRKNEEIFFNDTDYIITRLKYVVVDRGNDQRKLASAIVDVVAI